MKKIGQTVIGNPILEASPTEYRTLCILAEVAKGKTIPYEAYTDRRDLDEDFEAVLMAIQEWIQIEDRANSLRILADQIERALKVKLEE